MEYEMLIRLLLAALWGGIIGAEREYRNKSAGFRTLIMISLGSCFFTIMSIKMGGSSSADRIASNIVTGIGFLGAGVIFRNESRINGITTAATIWLVAAVGMGIGAGYYNISEYAGIMVLVVLVVLPYFEKMIDRVSQLRNYNIRFPASDEKKEAIEQLFKKHKLNFRVQRFVKKSTAIQVTWQVNGKKSYHESFVEEIMTDKELEHFEY